MRKSIFRREIECVFAKYKLECTELPSGAETEILKLLFDSPHTSSEQYLLKKTYCNVKSVEEAIGGISLSCEKDEVKQKLISDIRSLFIIDDDLELPSRLRTQLEQKEKIAIFVGSGVSRLIAYPSWNELASMAVDYIYKMNFISHAEKEKILSEASSPKHKLSVVQNIAPWETMYAFYKNVFGNKNKSTINPYDELVKIDSLKLSVNYDMEYWMSLRDYVASKAECKSPENLKLHDPILFDTAFDKETPMRNDAVYQIHGSCEHLSSFSVITLRNYLDHYYLDPKQKLSLFLKNVFNNYVTLFVGCGMEEFEIIQHLVRCTKEHHMLVSTYVNDTNLLRMKKEYFKKELGIEVHGYYMDFQGYTRLYYVIKSWAQKIIEEQNGGIYYKISEANDVKL